MKFHCPNCGTAFLHSEIRRPEDAAPRVPVIGSMVLCGGCGDCFEVGEALKLLPWTKAVPDHIARISSVIKMGRAYAQRFKAVLN